MFTYRFGFSTQNYRKLSVLLISQVMLTCVIYRLETKFLKIMFSTNILLNYASLKVVKILIFFVKFY